MHLHHTLLLLHLKLLKGAVTQRLENGLSLRKFLDPVLHNFVLTPAIPWSSDSALWKGSGASRHMKASFRTENPRSQQRRLFTLTLDDPVHTFLLSSFSD